MDRAVERVEGRILGAVGDLGSSASPGRRRCRCGRGSGPLPSRAGAASGGSACRPCRRGPGVGATHGSPEILSSRRAGAEACLPLKTVEKPTESARRTPAIRRVCGRDPSSRTKYLRSTIRGGAAARATAEVTSAAIAVAVPTSVERLFTRPILRLPAEIAMPEGDTIHRVATRFEAALVGKEMETAEAPNARSPIHRRAGELAGLTLERAEARGKHLLLHFSGDRVVHSHLGMNGRWFVRADGRMPYGRPWLLLGNGPAVASQSGGRILRLTSAARARNDPVLLPARPRPARPRLRRRGCRRAAARLRADGPGRRGAARPDPDRRDRQRDPDRGLLPAAGQPVAEGRRPRARGGPRHRRRRRLGDGDDRRHGPSPEADLRRAAPPVPALRRAG